MTPSETWTHLEIIWKQPSTTRRGLAPLFPFFGLYNITRLDVELTIETARVPMMGSMSLGVPTLASRRQRQPTMLLPSEEYGATPYTPLCPLLRLSYIHSTLNPAVQSPYVPWLLAPLYSALVGETDREDVAHAEVNTSWVFEVLVGEIAELREEGKGRES